MQTAEKDELGETTVEIDFANERLLLDACGIIYLPEHSTLLVSDLHFEKGSYFAARRSPLPIYDTLETLDCLQKALAKYSPKTIICMGDSFHDYNAEHRIDQADAERLNALCKGVCDWVWILGNHDKYFPSNIIGRQEIEYKIGQINLSHERTEAAYEIIGHWHPKARISISEHKISGKAFIYDPSLMIMPSFGTFTGGLYTDSPQIQQLFAAKPKTYMIYNKKIWKI